MGTFGTQANAQNRAKRSCFFGFSNLAHDVPPIFPSDLLNSCARFKVNSKFLGDTDFNIFDELENAGDDPANEHLYEPIPSLWQLAFEDLRALMRPLSPPNDSIYKRTVRDGDASVQPAAHCRLTIHYNAYFEHGEQPFDSTYLRGQPMVFVTGQLETLPGLELACLSMRAGEESQFVIPYALLYGDLGCPVRIPPCADGLFIIQLLKVAEVGDDRGLAALSEAERHQYAIVMPQALNVCTKGIDSFRRGDYTMAIRMFHKAVAGLEACTLATEADTEGHRKQLLRLYTNLMLCYNKTGQPRRTCLMFADIERLEIGGRGVRNNSKALFQHGRALLQLGEFKRAAERLQQAQRLQPTNAEITAELKLLAQKQEAHELAERQLWQRAFGTKVVVPKTTAAVDLVDADGAMESQFREMTLQCLEQFSGDERVKTLQLPGGLTSTEVTMVERLISGMSIQLEVRGNAEKTYTLRKVAA